MSFQKSQSSLKIPGADELERLNLSCKNYRKTSESRGAIPKDQLANLKKDIIKLVKAYYDNTSLIPKKDNILTSFPELSTILNTHQGIKGLFGGAFYTNSREEYEGIRPKKDMPEPNK